MRLFPILVLGSWVVTWCSPAVADVLTGDKLAEAARREARGILSQEMFGHYDVTRLELLKVEEVDGLRRFGKDYGLVKAILEFSATRNATRSPGLNPDMFEPGSEMCQGWLVLHCGVPAGHVFEGTLEVLLAFDRDATWRAVSPHWRSRREYPLHGYLLPEGNEKEGYLPFPEPR